jgi:large subunit ribosomal protein L13
MATYIPKASNIEREWHVVDADGMVLGRLCTEVARLLRGKHKPIYTPNVDTGDHVIIINADKVVMTAGKAERTIKYRHSGYPGGISSESYAHFHARRPAEAVRRSVKGMLPKGPLGRQQLTKLKVYAGPDHPHGAQSPSPLEFAHAKAR